MIGDWGKSKIRKKHFIFFLCLLCFFLSISLAASALSSRKEIKEDRLNLLLITIDTLRADRLSCYSSEYLKTPNIDGLAEEGILFSRAFSNTSTTLPSHANILLGTTPLYHGVHVNANFIIREEFLTLAEHLKNYGYLTGAFVGAYPLDSRFGLAQGFDIYDDDYETVSSHKFAYGERKAELVVDNALDWLKTQKSPWFLWVHCFDPHDPYEPPEPFKAQYKENPYDGEVAYVDFALGKLFSYMKENDIFDKTLIIFTSDHGESLGQHGERFHGFFAYNATIWVPLIISIPGVRQGHVEQYVSHIDIFPTVCDVIGVKKPPSLQGISLLSSIKGKKLPKRTFYFESLYPYYNRGWAPLKGYIREKEKFIDSPIPELYDLKEDFDELKNLTEKKKLDRYKKQLAQIIKSQSFPENFEAQQKIDRKSLEILESLGYISSPQISKKESYGLEDDVKILLPHYNKAMEAMDIYQEGKVNEAIELIKDVIKEKKNIDIAYSNLGTLYKKEGKLKESLETLKLGLERCPSSYIILINYVHYLIDAGNYDIVIDVINTKNLHLMELDSEIWNCLGFAYWSKGNLEKALEAYEKALSLDNEYVNVFCNLGTVYLSIFLKTEDHKAYQKSLQNYNKAIELDPNYAPAYNGLGNAYRQMGNLEGAINCWKKALKLSPDLSHTFYNLILAYLDKGDKVKALDSFNKYKEKYYHLLPAAERQKLDALIEKLRQKL